MNIKNFFKRTQKQEPPKQEPQKFDWENTVNITMAHFNCSRDVAVKILMDKLLPDEQKENIAIH